MEWERKEKEFCFGIDWLIKADMMHISRRATKKKYDLDEYTMDDSFRVYISDLSLLMAMADVSLKQQIIDDVLQGEIKDVVCEYAAADALYKIFIRMVMIYIFIKMIMQGKKDKLSSRKTEKLFRLRLKKDR